MTNSMPFQLIKDSMLLYHLQVFCGIASSDIAIVSIETSSAIYSAIMECLGLSAPEVTLCEGSADMESGSFMILEKLFSNWLVMHRHSEYPPITIEEAKYSSLDWLSSFAYNHLLKLLLQQACVTVTGGTRRLMLRHSVAYRVVCCSNYIAFEEMNSNHYVSVLQHNR
ncbi:hypothetical protein SCA6_002090 [Theobroma cacao]